MTAEYRPAIDSTLVWLLGQPHLGEYLTFVRENVIGGDAIDVRGLVDEWRAANEVYARLEQREAGVAERIKCRKLPKRLSPGVDAVRAQPWFDKAFGELPTTFELVELDKLIVSQNHVDGDFAARLRATMAPEPTVEALFDLCIPIDRALAPVRIQRHAANHWTFACGSTDFRAHDAVLLRDGNIPGAPQYGPLACMLGIGIGFGSNCMSAIRSGKRVLLQNGNHRAYALRAMGVTHAPCIVEEVTRKDELKLVASENVCEDPEFYFAAKRPPLLKDFFDPRIAKTLAILPIETTIEIEIKVKRTTPTSVTPD